MIYSDTKPTYDISDLGFDRNLIKSSQEEYLYDSETGQESSSSIFYDSGYSSSVTPALLNSISDGVSPSVIDSGDVISQLNQPTGKLFSGKTLFDNSETGYILGVDASDSLVKFYIGTSSSYFNFDGTNVNIAGTLTAESGLIAGWTISAAELSSGNVKIQSTAERILLGSATAPLTGVGIFIGKDGSDYELRAGDPANAYIHWDGSTFTMNKISITEALLSALTIGSEPAIQQWQFTSVFSATDNNTIAWTAGTLTLADGSSYSIDAGNTGDISATTYVYFAKSVSQTVLQTSTTAANAAGAGKILIAVTKNVADATKFATYQVFSGTGGIGGTFITADSIAATTITASEIAANTITANKMNVASLSAIAADLGTITAGTITLSSSGYIKGGQTAYNTGTGFWLGYDTSAYKLSIGSSTQNLTWDGTNLSLNNVGVSASIKSFTAGEYLHANDSLYLHSDGKVYRTDASSATTLQYVGFANSAVATDASVLVTMVGYMSGFSGLTPGSVYYTKDAAQSIDQQNTGGANNDSDALVGQSFTVGAGISYLSKFSLNLENGSGSDWTVTMNIRQGENIAGTIIATKTIVISTGNGNVYTDFDFSSSWSTLVPVTAGQQYTIEIANQGTFTKWHATSTSAYAGGKAYWQGAFSSTVDRNFKVYHWNPIAGSINTTAGSNSQKVGRALSATEIMVVPGV